MAELLESLRAALADRYAIERELGRGGMAIVFLAHDRKLDRDVALRRTWGARRRPSSRRS